MKLSTMFKSLLVAAGLMTISGQAMGQATSHEDLCNQLIGTFSSGNHGLTASEYGADPYGAIGFNGGSRGAWVTDTCYSQNKDTGAQQAALFSTADTSVTLSLILTRMGINGARIDLNNVGVRVNTSGWIDGSSITLPGDGAIYDFLVNEYNAQLGNGTTAIRDYMEALELIAAPPANASAENEIGASATFEASASVELLDKDLGSETIVFKACSDAANAECGAGTAGQLDGNKNYPGAIWGAYGFIKVNSTQKYSLDMVYSDGAGATLEELVHANGNKITTGAPAPTDLNSETGALQTTMADAATDAAANDRTDAEITTDLTTLQGDCATDADDYSAVEADSTSSLFGLGGHVATTAGDKSNIHCFNTHFSVPGSGVQAGEYTGNIKVTLTSEI